MMVEIFQALNAAEKFIAGFEGDELQEGIDGPEGLLHMVRTARQKVGASWGLGGRVTYPDQPARDQLAVIASRLHLADPEQPPMDLAALADTLSHISRPCGDARAVCSAAQYCVLCSHTVLPEFALTALMHDAVAAVMFFHGGAEPETHPEVMRANQMLLSPGMLAQIGTPWPPERARDEFIHRFNKLTGSNFDAGPIFEE